MIAVAPADATMLDVLTALHAGCFAEAWERPALARLLAMPGAFALLAQSGGGPVGFVLARQAADELEIVSIGVLPDRRRQGAAGALLRTMHARAAAAGAVAAFLEVAEGNAAARALYTAMGYAVVGRRPGYYRLAGRAEDALVMRRRLRDGPAA
jgi:ribosomal-protein-alanine N-acetyltransferase